MDAHSRFDRSRDARDDILHPGVGDEFIRRTTIQKLNAALSSTNTIVTRPAPISL
jgi:hypothetical protein